MKRTRSSSNNASPPSGPSSDQDFHSCGSNSSTEEEDIQPTSQKRHHITSDHEPVVTILTIEDLDEVLEMINKHNFDVTKYEEIGLYLGLFKTTIDAIKEECRGNPHKCFMQILAKWLCRADKVNKKGIPTWFTLIKKIQLIDIAAAGRIHDDVHPACRIFKSVLQNHSVREALPLFSMLLIHEDIIDEVPVDVQCTPEGATSLLEKVQKSVCHNHENLKKFAFIFKKYKRTAKEGCTLMKKYIEKFGGDDIMAQERKDLVSIDISLSSSSEFLYIRTHLASTFRAVDDVIHNIEPPLNCRDVKNYIRFARSDLKVEIDTCVEVVDVLFVIREHCSLLNIELLEALVKEFKIEGAKKAIQDYKAYLEVFFDRVKGKFCLEQKINLCSSLKCETITVTVDKDVEQICFEDIGILMKSVFENLSSSIHVHVIRRDNSFTIICSFSLALSASLISTALKNLKVLKEKEIIKLTIGYCTVYDYKEGMFYTKEGEPKDSSGEELQDYITPVYTSRGTLEQLLVSTSVQLMNSEEETISLNEEMLKMKMKAESMEKSLEGKKKMLSAVRRENENFKQIADENRKLVQEKMKHKTENEALKETIHLLEEQLALFQSEKEEPKDDDIRKPKAKDQELEELKIGLNEEMLKMKMKAESMEKLLEDKSKMLSAVRRENENFKQIADENRKLVQEKMKHETENEALEEIIYLLEEQLALFQSEKEEPQDDDIRMLKAKDHELEELKIGIKARCLFQKYIKELDHILISPIYIKVSLMLYSKRCINEATLDKIETDHRSSDDKKPLLIAMQEAVHNDYGKLKGIANILANFDETREIANQMKTKYGELTAGYNLRGCKGLARGKKRLVTGSFFLDGHNTDKERKLEIDEVTSIKRRLIFHEEKVQKLRKLLREKYNETLTEDSGKVDWSGDMVHLINPSSAQCKEVILELTDGHWNIRLERIQADNIQLLVKAFLQRDTVKWFSISYTPLTPEVIQLVNKHMLTLKRLSLLNDSIGDTEVILLIQSLKYNNTLACLSLYNNPRLTSVSATSLAELIDKNSTLTYLSVCCTSLTFDGILQMLKALTKNKTLTKLELDKHHEYACSSTSCFSLVKNTLAFYPD